MISNDPSSMDPCELADSNITLNCYKRDSKEHWIKIMGGNETHCAIDQIDEKGNTTMS